MQRHGPLPTSVKAQVKALGFGPASRVFQFAAFTFDASLGDIFCALASGGTSCMPSDAERVDNLADIAKCLKVTQACLTPSVGRLMSPADVPTLKKMTLGGESPSITDYEIWSEAGISLLQVYGPTETAIWCFGVQPVQRDRMYPLRKFGVPLTPGLCSYWVVHPNDPERLSAVGAIGELLIGGPLLADGYLNDVEKTNAAFLPAPAWAKEQLRLYKTGDLVRLCEDGQLEYVSRIDTQVKLNGVRIELGEIEHQLRKKTFRRTCRLQQMLCRPLVDRKRRSW